MGKSSITGPDTQQNMIIPRNFLGVNSAFCENEEFLVLASWLKLFFQLQQMFLIFPRTATESYECSQLSLWFAIGNKMIVMKQSCKPCGSAPMQQDRPQVPCINFMESASQMHRAIYPSWLVVWNMNFIVPYIGNNHPN